MAILAATSSGLILVPKTIASRAIRHAAERFGSAGPQEVRDSVAHAPRMPRCSGNEQNLDASQHPRPAWRRHHDRRALASVRSAFLPRGLRGHRDDRPRSPCPWPRRGGTRRCRFSGRALHEQPRLGRVCAGGLRRRARRCHGCGAWALVVVRLELHRRADRTRRSIAHRCLSRFHEAPNTLEQLRGHQRHQGPPAVRARA